ncbi:MAG: 2Fe-2S iron-sulfur cluster-binding protein [Deltaproteobacteria bacterium]|nr:2Fe-2S iron-sulfur cluster-binding protein [Deltaproteobacteria bacterium]
MPTFYLDDQPVDFKQGETLLQAADRAGIYIPRYCYHPGLKITAQCRMCLVEITDMGNGRGMPRLQASCATPAAENMRISITSEKALNAQKTVNEFQLVNHPLDCPICDQAGECDLQDISFLYGTGRSEMNYEKRVSGNRDVGTFLMLERNRCIQCSRCERFSRDLVGTHDFAVFNRSHEVSFDTYGDHRIVHRFQGNLADLCPVGAITQRDWRFRKRAWKLKKTPGVCTTCSTGCNITLDSHQNHIYRISPRENLQVNRWWLCDEGRINFRGLNYHPGSSGPGAGPGKKTPRLEEPQLKARGKARDGGWDGVLEALAPLLKEVAAAKGSVAALADTHATNEELFLLKTLLAEGFGSDKLFFPLQKGKAELRAPAGLEDTFLYSLINTDKSPNTAGAQALGLKGLDGPDALKGALGGKVKIMLVLGSPWEDDPIAGDISTLADLVIYLGVGGNAWSKTADVVLPGFTHAEKYGSFVNRNNLVQRIRPAISPPPQARDQVRTLCSLLGALDREANHADGRDVLAALGAAEGPFKGLNWEALGDGGMPLPGKG